MIIIDNDTNKKTDNICILLKYSEAVELRDALNQLIEANDFNTHHHVNSEDFSREITIAMYNETHLDSFNERIRKLIIED